MDSVWLVPVALTQLSGSGVTGVRLEEEMGQVSAGYTEVAARWNVWGRAEVIALWLHAWKTAKHNTCFLKTCLVRTLPSGIQTISDIN